MSPRRRAREVALQILFAMDAGEPNDAKTALKTHDLQFAAAEEEEGGAPADPFDRAYTEELVAGVTAHRAELDGHLEKLSRSWRIERMARLDRNILRLALFELVHHREDVPARVVLNEAVELAKLFGAAESPAFVNGMLDSALDLLGLR